MKKDWTYKKLGEVAEIVMGQSPAGSSLNETDGIEFHQGKVAFGEKYLEHSGCFTNEPTKLTEGHSLLLCVRAPVGILNMTDRKICIGRGLCAITAKEITDTYYLFYALKSKQSYFEKNATGSTFKAISSAIVKDTIIPIPPLSIQRSIVAELDLLHSVISKKKEQLRELDNLAQSLFYQMFGDPITNPMGWEIKKLGEVTLEKLSYGSGASAIDFDNEVRYVRITDINDDGSLNENAVSPSVCEDKYLLHCGDILFARTGATVGKTYLHLESAIKCIYAGYLIRFIPNKEIINPSYAFHFTKTRYYHDFVAQSQRAVAQPNINAQQYSNLSLPLPPLSLQQSFAAKIEAIEAQKQAVQQSIREIEALLAERMDNYFG